MPILVRAKLNPLGLSIPLHFPLRTWLLFFWGAHDGGFVQDGCGRGNGGDDSVGRYPIIIIIDAHIKGHTEMAIKNDSTQSVAPTGSLHGLPLSDAVQHRRRDVYAGKGRCSSETLSPSQLSLPVWILIIMLLNCLLSCGINTV